MSISTSLDRPLGPFRTNSNIDATFFGEGEIGPISNPILNPQIILKDTSVIAIGNNFTITGDELKRSLKVLAKIMEKDYPEELI